MGDRASGMHLAHNATLPKKFQQLEYPLMECISSQWALITVISLNNSLLWLTANDQQNVKLYNSGVPRGGLEGFKPPNWIFKKKICIVCLQNILSKPCSYVH